MRRAPREGEVQWNPAEPLDPAKLAGCDAVVHLAGKNIAGYWTEKFKREVRDSRVQGTQTLANAAAESYRQTGQPRVFVCASAIGYYGDRGDELLTEESLPGSGFLPDVTQQWEAATNPARDAGLRVVNLRIRRGAGPRWRRAAVDAAALSAGTWRTSGQRTAVLELGVAG